METPEEREPPNVITSDTDNATKVEPKEAPPEKRAKFRRFRAYNRGTWNGPKRENKDVVHRQDNLHRYDSVASAVCLTQYQKARGRQVFDQIDLGELGISIDEVIFGVCVLVANADIDGGSRYYPYEDSANDQNFSELVDSLGLTKTEEFSAIEKVRKRVDL